MFPLLLWQPPVAESATGVVDGASVTCTMGDVSATGNGIAIPGGGSVDERALHGPRRQRVRRIVDHGTGVIAGLMATPRMGAVTAHASSARRVAGLRVSTTIGDVRARGVHNPTDEMIAILLAA